jgi:sec-independent protein translocase protein TatA
MFGSLGAPEILVIFIVALIVFGPSKLPEFGKSLGEAIRGFKKAINEGEKTALENPQPPVKTAESSNPSARIEDKV